MRVLKTTLYRYDEKTDEEQEINLEVEYEYYPGCKGARDSCCGVRGAGPLLEPDEDPDIEIVSVFDVDKNEEIELTKQEKEDIEEEVWDEIGELWESRRGDREDY